jgi:hypothetical protein
MKSVCEQLRFKLHPELYWKMQDVLWRGQLSIASAHVVKGWQEQLILASKFLRQR